MKKLKKETLQIGTNYKILPTRQFEKDINKIDNSIKNQLKKKIEEIAIDPTRYKHLHSPLNKYSRLRIGKWRIVFDYDLERKEIYLRKIIFGHKY